MDLKKEFTSSEALFELSLLNAEEATSLYEDFYLWATERGIPPEILTRMKPVWDFTKVVAGEVVSIGKIIVNTVVNFIKNNPNLVAGIALGAAFGLLASTIPFLAPLLAPFGGIVATIYGAGIGAALDNGESTNDATNPFIAAINLARKFFELLINIFKAVISHYEE